MSELWFAAPCAAASARDDPTRYEELSSPSATTNCNLCAHGEFSLSSKIYIICFLSRVLTYTLNCILIVLMSWRIVCDRSTGWASTWKRRPRHSIGALLVKQSRVGNDADEPRRFAEESFVRPGAVSMARSMPDHTKSSVCQPHCYTVEKTLLAYSIFFHLFYYISKWYYLLKPFQKARFFIGAMTNETFLR